MYDTSAQQYAQSSTYGFNSNKKQFHKPKTTNYCKKSPDFPELLYKDKQKQTEHK